MYRITGAQATIIAAVITGVFGILIFMISPIFKSDPSGSLPAGVPTTTPKPTVVGTPIIGADIAAGGGIGFTVVANNITLVVDDVKAYRKSISGMSAGQGYVFVISKVRVSNASTFLLSAFDFYLLDDFSNQYVDWGVYASDFNLVALSSPIIYGRSGAGVLIFRVPEAALMTNLTLRLDPKPSPVKNEPSTRLEIFLGSGLKVLEKPSPNP